ncbi:MAG: CBS domain-containing protein [Geminicoccaceae bacterium]
MTPTSYQGPLEGDDKTHHTHSQSEASNLGIGQPGVTVGSILVNKGDDIFTVSPSTTVKEVVAELNRLRVGALVVVNQAKEPVGIVSERDIVRNADIKGLGVFDQPVEEIMTPDPKCAVPADKVEAVMKQMTESRFRHMPVLQDGKLCGLISIGDVVNHRMREIEYENLKIKQAMVG